MMDAKTTLGYDITWLIRRLFRALAAEADFYLSDANLSSADRAIMEFLHREDALSVPDIARCYDVSRQHVQVTVNSLVDRGLLISEENPRHKRSRLIRLSRVGRSTFDEIRRNETAYVSKLFDGLPDDDLNNTRKTLETLLARLK